MDDLFAVARSGLDFNNPMGHERAATLAASLAVAGGRVLDLGCGQGSLLLDVVEVSPGATGDGVDLDAAEIARARAAAAARGLAERVAFHEADAAPWPGRDYDAAMAVGASHAWGDTSAAAAGLARHVRPGGRGLLGGGFWAAPPTLAALGGLGAEPGELGDLDALTGAVRAAGLEVVEVQVATQEEWDAFEAAWRAPLERLDEARARALAADRRAGYEQGY